MRGAGGTVATIVTAVIRRGESVLLVRQNDPGAADAWVLPGGMVEAGEHLQDALRREIREETGLAIADPATLAWVSQTVITVAGSSRNSTAFAFVVPDPGGEPQADDPDKHVLEARFVPLAEAIGRLGQLRYQILRDPAISFLTGSAPPAAVWIWEQVDGRPHSLVTTVPPLGLSADG